MRIWLRDHWRTTVLVTAVAAAATVAVEVAAGFGGLRLTPVPALDAGLRWTSASLDPGTLGQAAVRQAAGWLAAVGWAGALVGIVCILTLAAQQAAVRTPEIAIHRAVGASRRTLAVAALAEGLLVVGVGVGLGTGLATAIGATAAARWPGGSAGWEPAWLATVVTVGVAVLIGSLFPLWGARRRRVAEVDLAPPPLGIPALQLGAALAVLVAGATLVRHGAPVEHAGQLLPSAEARIIRFESADSTVAGRAGTLGSLLDRLQADSAGADRGRVVSVASPGAHTGTGTVDELMTECGQCFVGGIFLKYRPLQATYHTASADTFRARGARLVAGRVFDRNDDHDSARVAVVNLYLARRYFQDGEAVGRQLFPGGRLSGTGYRVIGVVDDGRAAGLGGGSAPLEAVYLSSLQHPPRVVEVLIESGTGSRPPPEWLDRQPIGSYRPIDRLTGADLGEAIRGPVRWFGRLFLVEGALVLGLAIAGTMSLMLLWVRALRQELAVRRSVGARRRQIVALVLGRAARTGLWGIGLALAFFGPALWPELGRIMPGVPVWEPDLVAGFGALLVAAALIAAVVPAIRAGQATPADLWRQR